MIGRRSKSTIEASWLLDLRPSPKGLPAPEWKIASKMTIGGFILKSCASGMRKRRQPWFKRCQLLGPRATVMVFFDDTPTMKCLQFMLMLKELKITNTCEGLLLTRWISHVYIHIYELYICTHVFIILFVSLLISRSLYIYLFSMRASHLSTCHETIMMPLWFQTFLSDSLAPIISKLGTACPQRHQPPPSLYGNLRNGHLRQTSQSSRTGMFRVPLKPSNSACP